MKKRTVAVLLSAYNGETNLAAQIDSVLRQDCDAQVTLFIRDDGSTDHTAAILRAYAAQHGNIEVLFGENSGLCVSFFALLRTALTRGFDYYAFCDQDDVWLPDKLSAALRALADVPQPMLYGGCSYLVDASLRKTGGTTQLRRRALGFFNTAIQNICPGHSQVLNRALAEVIVRRTGALDGVYSWDLWVANAAAVTGQIFFDPEPHTLYRQHGNNQLHYGTGKLAWAKSRLARLRKQEGRRFSTQLAAFAAAFASDLTAEQKQEVARYFAAQSSFFSRVRYACSTGFYRQRPLETLAFRVLYALGAYRPVGKESGV